MTKTAALNNAVNFLRYMVASLKSARDGEIANEARLVVDAINGVKAQQALCTNRVANDRAVNMIGEAMNIIAQRRVAA